MGAPAAEGTAVLVILVLYRMVVSMLLPILTGGQTLGMVPAQIRIVRRDGTSAGWGRLIVRAALVFAESLIVILLALLLAGGPIAAVENGIETVGVFGLLALGVLWIFTALTPHRTRPADLVARTLVISSPRHR